MKQFVTFTIISFLLFSAQKAFGQPIFTTIEIDSVKYAEAWNRYGNTYTVQPDTVTEPQLVQTLMERVLKRLPDPQSEEFSQSFDCLQLFKEDFFVLKYPPFNLFMCIVLGISDSYAFCYNSETLKFERECRMPDAVSTSGVMVSQRHFDTDTSVDLNFYVIRDNHPLFAYTFAVNTTLPLKDAFFGPKQELYMQTFGDGNYHRFFKIIFDTSFLLTTP